MTNELFHLSVVTGDATVLDTEVLAVKLPTSFGSVGILARHAPMLCAVSRGELRCTLPDGTGVRVRVSEGVACVDNNELTLLCADAAAAEE